MQRVARLSPLPRVDVVRRDLQAVRQAATDVEHGCPTGQTCIFDRCRRADPSGNGSGDGVICGGVMCKLSEQCCVNHNDDTALCAEAGSICPGVSALCDGKEDCGGVDRCCADGDAVTCDETCKTYACRDDDDCPLAAHTCCGATANAS